MLFQDPLFLAWFLPLSYLAFRLFPGKRNGMLLIASYLFYSWWNPIFLPLLLFSTWMNFVVGNRIYSGAGKRGAFWVFIGITINLLLLGFFKYYDFAASNLSAVIGQPVLPDLSIPLPLGISFFTFEGVSYLIDVYRGAKPSRTLKEFACFLSLFPHLIAGPIIRFPALQTQLQKQSGSAAADETAEGLYRFISGLAKKVLIADVLARIADPIFAASSLSTAQAWTGILAYTFQIYFDFSAYTSMAIGLGLLFGFRLPENFNSPYLSRSITEFWRRWHMTLSSWFRDYVYIPLGGSRAGFTRTLLNLVITMLLAGLWHGASWNFVLWGTYFGILLAVERLIGWDRALPFPDIFHHIFTFGLIAAGWVLFRSQTLTGALNYFSALIGKTDNPTVFPGSWQIIVIAIVGAFVLLEPSIASRPKRFSILLGTAMACLLIVSLFVAFGAESVSFIYFQF